MVVSRDAEGMPERMVGTHADISSLKKSEEAIWQHANFDSLTGLPNRRMFYGRLDQEIQKAKRSGLKVALIFLDLDGFKEVNDTLGHDQGDVLLKLTAARLVECMRGSDSVARLGGDEFVL
ncbi:MAG: GGDEF domain-containing protein, partial [Methylophilales bacterium 16-45-7]